ncbi:MAG: hypothetical protein AB9917_02080 [Negativicutes bacterium]
MIDSSIKAAGAFERTKPEFKDRFGKVFADPRDDIDDDKDLWVTLFVESDRINPNLSDALLGLRCVGAKLEKKESGGYVLRPHIDESGNCGFKDWAEYRDQAVKWLKPYLGPLKTLLADLDRLKKNWWG